MARDEWKTQKIQVISPSQVDTPGKKFAWNRTVPFHKQPLVRAASPFILLPAAFYFLNQFLQVRGVVSVIGSRAALYLALLLMVLTLCAIVSLLPRWRKTIGVVGTIVLLGVAIILDFHTLPTPKVDQAASAPKASAVPPPKQIALRPLFEKGEEGEIRLALNGPYVYTDRKGNKASFEGAILIDSQKQIYTFSFFVPRSLSTLEICEYLSHGPAVPFKNLEDLLKKDDQGDFFERPTSPYLMAIKHPNFSGKVFIYHESELPLYQRAQIDKDFRNHNMVVEFRGFDYALAQSY